MPLFAGPQREIFAKTLPILCLRSARRWQNSFVDSCAPGNLSIVVRSTLEAHIRIIWFATWRSTCAGGEVRAENPIIHEAEKIQMLARKLVFGSKEGGVLRVPGRESTLGNPSGTPSRNLSVRHYLPEYFC